MKAVVANPSAFVGAPLRGEFAKPVISPATPALSPVEAEREESTSFSPGDERFQPRLL